MVHAHKQGLMYRMPYGFGPTAGPRQGPNNKPFDWSRAPHRWQAAVSFLTDRDHLNHLLPPGFSLTGDPIVTVEFRVLSELPWLAGRGYSILKVNFPAAYNGEREKAVGSFCSVLWENLADPILSGREELGFAKLWCELPPPRVMGDRVTCTASWLGHEFAILELTDLTEAEPRIPAYPGLGEHPSDGTLHYKYIPQTGEWGKAAVAHACLTPPAGNPIVERLRVGKGRVNFRPATWEQMPTQFHIVQALSALPILEQREAWCVEIRGDSDLSQQRPLA
ncbi:acetoacetate decarboxylase family protein [Bradyrhizobium sp. WSM2793]|uniref:acetoacetate decarboxylase family protein n=1 Tax=Bradyrhizobium sp. WSM2793 TaxID=1038866 RepID=UPI0018DF0AA5|nr:acetoacetate decarboxylase family protein [Bradyrhizobium sp. WSM2793]